MLCSLVSEPLVVADRGHGCIAQLELRYTAVWKLT